MPRPSFLTLSFSEKRLNAAKFGRVVNSSDGRVVRASASGAVDLGLIPSRVKS